MFWFWQVVYRFIACFTAAMGFSCSLFLFVWSCILSNYSRKWGKKLFVLFNLSLWTLYITLAKHLVTLFTTLLYNTLKPQGISRLATIIYSRHLINTLKRFLYSILWAFTTKHRHNTQMQSVFESVSWWIMYL